MKDLIKFILVIAAVIGLLAWTSSLQQRSYEQATYKNCKQYEVLPESQTDRIPDGCIAQYWQNKVSRD